MREPFIESYKALFHIPGAADDEGAAPDELPYRRSGDRRGYCPIRLSHGTSFSTVIRRELN
jgi:hypothetical protein